MRDFSATLLEKELRTDGHYDVVLDRTAFYPEGGGQPCDLGSLNGIPVLDVQTKNGEIVHTIADDPGDEAISGRLDWQRRFDFMQQHTGEHLLSGVLLSQHQAENIGFHLTQATCQIDTTLPAMTPELAGELEAAVNAAIFFNMPIIAKFVESTELSNYKLRKQPGKEFEQIRLVSVKGCDCCPCGGTHVATTGEVGLLKIRGWEKHKKNIRIDFVCGDRAMADYQMKHEAVRTLSRLLSVPANGVVAAFERNQEKLDVLQKELDTVRKAYHSELAARRLAEAAGYDGCLIVDQVFSGYGTADLQDFAARITASPGAVALLASADPATGRDAFLFAAAPGLPSMNLLLRDCLLPLGGKGGGDSRQSQGGTTGVNPALVLKTAAELLRQRLG